MSTNQLFRRPTALLFSMLALALAPLAIGCGGDDGEDGPSNENSPGENNGGEHPLCDVAPTWEDFAQPFVQQQCLSCHSTSRTGLGRSGAPVGMNFDTEGDLRRHGDKSLSEVRAGKMPKDKKLDACYADQLEAFLLNG